MDKVHYVKDKNNITKQVEDLEAVKQCVSLTYAALKALRDQGELSPGQYYRITDYVTVTMQADTQSAGHQFDVIVRADSPSVLSETAWAAKHDGDNYFANAKLEAWQLKYCIDNDVARFGWVMRNSIIISGVEYLRSESDDIEGAAYPYCWVSGTNKRYTASETPSTGSGQAHSSSTGGSSYSISAVYTDDGSGKGVIYWMKDEFGNECGYDFKNIVFKRYKVTAMASNTSLVGLYAGYRDIQTNGSQGSLYPSGGTVSTSDTAWRFTFDLNGSDYSLTPRQYGCHGNIIAPLKLQDSVVGRERQWLNNITFGNTQNSAQCWGNKFLERCQSISFGNGCYANTFGQDCWYNTFGQYCQYNTFGQDCGSNTFGQDCGSNTFGQDCWYNTFGQYCYYNTFGQGVSFFCADLPTNLRSHKPAAITWDSGEYTVTNPDDTSRVIDVYIAECNLDTSETEVVVNTQITLAGGAHQTFSGSENAEPDQSIYVQYSEGKRTFRAGLWW